MLKKNVFIVTIFYSLALATVCLMQLNKLPETGISFADKIFHALSYGVLMVLWFNTLVFQFKISINKAILYAAIISIIFGIIIEVLQGVFTTTRKADMFDVIANSFGVLVLAAVIFLKNKLTVKKL